MEWGTCLEAMEAALELEKTGNESLLELAKDEPADLAHRHRLLANQGLHLEFLLPPTPTLSHSPQGAAVVAVVLLVCLPLPADMSLHLQTWFSHPLQWCLHRPTQLNLLERRLTGSWKRDLRRRE